MLGSQNKFAEPGSQPGLDEQEQLSRREGHPRPRGEVINLPGRSLGAKDAEKGYVHSMNGLEGKRGKKARQGGGEGKA